MGFRFVFDGTSLQVDIMINDFLKVFQKLFFVLLDLSVALVLFK